MRSGDAVIAILETDTAPEAARHSGPCRHWLILAGAVGSAALFLGAFVLTSESVPAGHVTPHAPTAPPLNHSPSCTYSDPGWSPISVDRALRCPDGTGVWVRGVVVRSADESVYLCSAARLGPHPGRLDDGFRVIGDTSEVSSLMIGVKQGATLVLATGSLVPADPNSHVGWVDRQLRAGLTRERSAVGYDLIATDTSACRAAMSSSADTGAVLRVSGGSPGPPPAPPR
jgi:hypothetical protein